MSKQEKDFASKNGYYRLGTQEVEIEIPLTTMEKMDLGKGQSESLCEIERLEGEFAKIKQDFKAKIETHQVIIKKTSVVLNRGSKIMKKELPAFLCPKDNRKMWVDISTGEVVKESEATEYDRQGSLID